MKKVALLLVLANLAVFGWIYSHQEQFRPMPARESEALTAGVERLVLLRERPPAESLAGADTKTPVTAAEPVPIETKVPEVGASDAGLPPVDHDRTSDTSDGAGAPTPPLVSQAGVVPDESTIPADRAEVDSRPEPVCHTLGPFAERQPVDWFVGQLVALGHAPTVRTSQMEEPSGYWVYLPAMPAEQARAAVRRLAENGVQDYFLGRQGVVSLGIFSGKRTAEVRIREIARLGFQPQVEPRFESREVYWLDLEESGTDRLSDEQWEGLLGAAAGARRQSVACQ